MADFFQFYKQFSSLDSITADEIAEKSKIKIFKKGDYLLESGKTCEHLFFINEGLLKIFFHKDDKEFIMRFFSENTLFSVFDSFLTQTPSNSNIIALENTTVTMISYKAMEELCKNNHSVETFYRKLVSKATVIMTKRIREMLEEDAAQRYFQFLAEHNLILQRISMGDIAKYLGITQQSLSRIRNQK